MKYYYDIEWTDYQYENNLTTTQMQEEQHVNEMIRRVDHMKWQDEQRNQWMQGEQPAYTVPDDCPF